MTVFHVGSVATANTNVRASLLLDLGGFSVLIDSSISLLILRSVFSSVVEFVSTSYRRPRCTVVSYVNAL
jgi:hypothetical protein